MRTFSKSKIQSIALRITVYASGLLTVGVLLCLVVYILIKGVPHLSLDLLRLKYSSENVSLLNALIK